MTSDQTNPMKTLKGRSKIQYIWDYYKLPLIILGILLYLFGYCLYRYLSYKETILYTALVNVTVGENLTQALTNNFLLSQNLNPDKNKLELYTGLYLTENEQNIYHQYTYASRIKILAAIDAERFDMVLMNQEAFDAFSQNGYLYNLEMFLLQTNPALYETVKSNLVSNLFILEDNSIERQLDTSLPYQAITEEHYYGIDLSDTKLIQNAGFEEPVYLGIIANSPRTDTVIAYLNYLLSPTVSQDQSLPDQMLE